MIDKHPPSSPTDSDASSIGSSISGSSSRQRYRALRSCFCGAILLDRCLALNNNCLARHDVALRRAVLFCGRHRHDGYEHAAYYGTANKLWRVSLYILLFFTQIIEVILFFSCYGLFLNHFATSYGSFGGYFYGNAETIAPTAPVGFWAACYDENCSRPPGLRLSPFGMLGGLLGLDFFFTVGVYVYVWFWPLRPLMRLRWVKVSWVVTFIFCSILASAVAIANLADRGRLPEGFQRTEVMGLVAWTMAYALLRGLFLWFLMCPECHKLALEGRIRETDSEDGFRMYQDLQYLTGHNLCALHQKVPGRPFASEVGHAGALKQDRNSKFKILPMEPYEDPADNAEVLAAWTKPSKVPDLSTSLFDEEAAFFRTRWILNGLKRSLLKVYLRNLFRCHCSRDSWSMDREITDINDVIVINYALFLDQRSHEQEPSEKMQAILHGGGSDTASIATTLPPYGSPSPSGSPPAHPPRSWGYWFRHPFSRRRQLQQPDVEAPGNTDLKDEKRVV